MADEVKATRVSNEQILEVINKLREDVEEIKKRTGFNDRPVEIPNKTNWNTDPGPFKSGIRG